MAPCMSPCMAGRRKLGQDHLVGCIGVKLNGSWSKGGRTGDQDQKGRSDKTGIRIAGEGGVERIAAARRVTAAFPEAVRAHLSSAPRRPITSLKVMRRSSMAAIVIVPALTSAAADVQGAMAGRRAG